MRQRPDHAGLLGQLLPQLARHKADVEALVGALHQSMTENGGPTPVRRPRSAGRDHLRGDDGLYTARPASKHHLIVEAHGIPLAAITTGGNRDDVTQLSPLIQTVPADPRQARPATAPPRAPVRRPRL
ncbi:hypothetical protein ACPEIC_10400 [Stenotrophomonas sp. NPDC087984]